MTIFSSIPTSRRRHRGMAMVQLAAMAMLMAPLAGADDPAQAFEFHLDGYTKSRFIAQEFPANSIFNELVGTGSRDLEADLRINFEASREGPWSLTASYQLFALYGDRIAYSRKLPATGAQGFDRLPNDRRRLFDLTGDIQDDGKFAALHRLDRLWAGYTGEKTVIRFGRQAITWGNGFFYSPMDIVNPFDPTAIDTEYKAGDDMLYGQYLRNNGDDTQAAVVFRRNPMSGDVDPDEATVTIKYHGIAGNSEFDLLVGQSYGDLTAGIGGNRSLGGAIWSGDLVVTNTRASTQAQFVTSLGYSWMWRGKNMSGVLEYYYNGFGQHGSNYDPPSLAKNPELLQRFARGELFTLGRNYLAASTTIEMTPLVTLTPILFSNLGDGSALLQLVMQHSLSNNLAILSAVNLPIGPDGTEYGGIGTGSPNQFFSTDLGLFAQLAWYF